MSKIIEKRVKSHSPIVRVSLYNFKQYFLFLLKEEQKKGV